MNQHTRLLKWLILNPQWLEKTHSELWNGEPTLLKIFLICKRVLNAKKPISFQALEWILRDKPIELAQVQYLINEDEIDKATALQIREDLRQVAVHQQIRMGQNLDMTDPKAQTQWIDTINRLKEEDVPEELKVSSFTEWSLHIQPETQTVDSGLPFLKGTGSDFMRGGLYNTVAPPNEGKSLTLSQIAKHQMHMGRNVLFFEMEGSDQENFNRLGHGLLKMTPHQYNSLTPEQIGQRFMTMELGNLDTIWGRIVYVEDLLDTIKDLEEKRGYEYDYVIIDYSAQVKLKNAKKTSQAYQDDEEVFRELKLLAIQSNKVIISAVQANRMGFNKKKQLDKEHVAGSLGSIRASDLMISQRYTTNIPEGLRPPYRETPGDEEPNDIKGLVKMTIIKKRKGTIQVGDVFYMWHLACGNLRQQVYDKTNPIEVAQWDNLFTIEDTDATN